MRVFKDEEIKWWYGIAICLGGLAPLLTAIQGEWIFSAISLLIIIIFLQIAPYRAEADINTITFVYPLRKARFTPQSLNVVKVSGAYDYSAHISLRNKGLSLPTSYRCRQFRDAPVLAQAVLDLIELSPQTKVDEDAFRLMRQVVQGSNKPLSRSKK